MKPRTLDADAIRHALELRDLSDPAQGPHALQLILDAVEDRLRTVWGIPVQRHRQHPVVSITDNYDRLGYPPDGLPATPAIPATSTTARCCAR